MPSLDIMALLPQYIISGWHCHQNGFKEFLEQIRNLTPLNMKFWRLADSWHKEFSALVSKKHRRVLVSRNKSVSPQEREMHETGLEIYMEIWECFKMGDLGCAFLLV